MKHPSIATTLGLLVLGYAGLAATAASAASPVGYWLKEDGAAKMQISRCGGGELCSKIVWLRNPLDSRGQPLHDARNKDVSLRNRPILGLSIFRGLTPAGDDTWGGQIYNPEDGGTYKATLTMVSSDQIVLKGCMAFFLCGQKTWTRTSFTPPAPATPSEPSEIDVKNGSKDDSQPQIGAKPDQQAEAQTPKPTAPSRIIEASMTGIADGAATASHASTHILNPTLPPARKDATAGYGFVLTTSSPEAPPKLTEGDPSDMYLLTPVTDPASGPSNVSSDGTDANATPRPVSHGGAAPDQSVATTGSTERSATDADATADAQRAIYQPASYRTDQAPAVTEASATDETGAVPLPDPRPPELDAYVEIQALESQDHLSWRDRRRLRKLRRELPLLEDPAAAETQTLASNPQGLASASLQPQQ
jgi:uncharacterized protein (DUF2147 family)